MVTLLRSLRALLRKLSWIVFCCDGFSIYQTPRSKIFKGTANLSQIIQYGQEFPPGSGAVLDTPLPIPYKVNLPCEKEMKMFVLRPLSSFDAAPVRHIGPDQPAQQLVAEPPSDQPYIDEG